MPCSPPLSVCTHTVAVGAARGTPGANFPATLPSQEVVATRTQPSPRRRGRFSPSFQRAIPWIAGAILLAGIAAFAATRIADNKTGHETDAPLSNKPAVVPK